MNQIIYEFKPKLKEGFIIKRKNQFLIEVLVDNKIEICHCPTTEQIGGIVCKELPCLLSTSDNKQRKTLYTVEAISLDLKESKDKQWIGINQNLANRFVENCISNNLFKDMIKNNLDLKREQFLGNSKLDFLVDNTYIEVKTPLTHFQVFHPSHIQKVKSKKDLSFNRFIKHINELANSLKTNQRAILLTCFLYDNPGFKPLMEDKNSNFIKDNVLNAIKKGIEIWQVNFEINPNNVKLIKVFETTKSFIDM